MRLGIDASNLRAGGTKTYLIELLRAGRPAEFGFDEVLVWGGSAVLEQIEERPWLRKCRQPLLEQAANPYSDRRHLHRAYWQRFRLRELMQSRRCDILFVPGGMDNSGARPMVTMSQNMLVFDRAEARRYGISAARLRLEILRRLQARTFRRADGVIFLSDYARSSVLGVVDLEHVKTIVVPHGVNPKFSCPPRAQRPIDTYSAASPFRILYVSTVDLYKHQWHVIDAVAKLRAAGLPVRLDLVGPAYGAGKQRLQRAFASLGSSAGFVRYIGAVPHHVLCALYRDSELKVFASSCENMPIILLEAMSAGLPIACSRRGPMPDLLGDAGTYFDPESPVEIHDAIAALLNSPTLRARCAADAFARAQRFSWERCAVETFGFLAQRAGECRRLIGN